MSGLQTQRGTTALRIAGVGFGRFLIVGLAGLATDAAMFQMLTGGGAAPMLARAVSIIAATAVTWQLNRRFVFDTHGRSVVDEAARYATVALMAQGANYLGFVLLCHLIPGTPPIVFLFLCSAGIAAGSFAGQRLFTFRQP